MAGHSRRGEFWVIGVWYGQVMEIARRYVPLIGEAIIGSPGPRFTVRSVESGNSSDVCHITLIHPHLHLSEKHPCAHLICAVTGEVISTYQEKKPQPVRRKGSTLPVHEQWPCCLHLGMKTCHYQEHAHKLTVSVIHHDEFTLTEMTCF